MKDTCIFTFGRMNPPHRGHEQVFDKALEIFRNTNNSSLKVFVSKSSYSTKNPLPYDIKIKYIKELFPSIASKIQKNHTNLDLFGIMEILNTKYKNVIFVGGSDRIDDFQKKLDEYNHVLYNFDTIKCIQAGTERCQYNYSSTQMRNAVLNEDSEEFFSCVPGDDNELKKRMYFDVQLYMGMGKISKNYVYFEN